MDPASLTGAIGPVTTTPTNFPLIGGGPFTTDFDCDGVSDGGRVVQGTGVFISPSAVLTNAHCLFARRPSGCPSSMNFRFIGGQTATSFTPAQFRNAGGNIVNPFGTYNSRTRLVPRKYTLAGSGPYKRDIGLVLLDRHFTGGRTFMAIQFGDVKRVQVVGYPSNLFPTLMESTANIVSRYRRYQTYGINTSRGVSGSPQIDPRTNRIVGLHNAGFLWPACAGGPRFANGNVATLRSFIDRAFANDVLTAPDGAVAGGELPTLPWPVVMDMTLSDPSLLIPLEEVRLINPEVDTQLPVARHCFQVLQGEHYEWQEFDVNPGADESEQFVRMLRPIDYWMPVPDAHALLSASRNWGARYNIDPLSVENPEIDQANGEGFTIEMESQEAPQDEDDDFEEEEFIDSLEGDTPGDLNNDDWIDAADLGVMLAGWGQQSAGDLNGDGMTGAADLGIMLANWNPNPN